MCSILSRISNLKGFPCHYLGVGQLMTGVMPDIVRLFYEMIKLQSRGLTNPQKSLKYEWL
jgi:hypothetical protein